VTQATVQESHEFTPHSAPSGASSHERSAQENLESFASGFFEGAGPALTTVLNRKVTVSVLEVVQAKPADLLARMPLPWVVVEATYQRGMSGVHWLLFSQPNAVALGQDAPGGVEGDGELRPAHQEAIRDAINQMLASAGPALMPLFGRSLSFAPVAVHVIEEAEVLPQELAPQADRVWLARARATGADGFAVDMTLTISQELARGIAALGADEPAAPAPQRGERVESAPSKIDLIMDVTLPVTVELGRARMQIQDILKLSPGSVIELDKSSGDPVELFINDRPIAKGEVVIIDENFGVRLTSIVTATERIRTLR
jgi:flagellar motor switch protein FliN/FliY